MELLNWNRRIKSNVRKQIKELKQYIDEMKSSNWSDKERILYLKKKIEWCLQKEGGIFVSEVKMIKRGR